MKDYEFDVIKLSYCKKHKEYWVTNCPECIADQERLNVLSELREMWAYEQASGHPVFSISLDKWVKYCRNSKVPFDWWELKSEVGV